MTLSHTAPLLGRLMHSSLVRRVLAVGSPLAGIDLSTVVVDEAEVWADLADAFSRGPFASLSLAAPGQAP